MREEQQKGQQASSAGSPSQQPQHLQDKSSRQEEPTERQSQVKRTRQVFEIGERRHAVLAHDTVNFDAGFLGDGGVVGAGEEEGDGDGSSGIASGFKHGSAPSSDQEHQRGRSGNLTQRGRGRPRRRAQTPFGVESDGA